MIASTENAVSAVEVGNMPYLENVFNIKLTDGHSGAQRPISSASETRDGAGMNDYISPQLLSKGILYTLNNNKTPSLKIQPTKSITTTTTTTTTTFTNPILQGTPLSLHTSSSNTYRVQYTTITVTTGENARAEAQTPDAVGMDTTTCTGRHQLDSHHGPSTEASIYNSYTLPWRWFIRQKYKNTPLNPYTDESTTRMGVDRCEYIRIYFSRILLPGRHHTGPTTDAEPLNTAATTNKILQKIPPTDESEVSEESTQQSFESSNVHADQLPFRAADGPPNALHSSINSTKRIRVHHPVYVVAERALLRERDYLERVCAIAEEVLAAQRALALMAVDSEEESLDAGGRNDCVMRLPY